MQTTMSHTPKQLTSMASNKPKARDEVYDFLKPSTTPKLAKRIIPRSTTPIKAIKPVRASRDNKLLAGYLAHEFLTKGTFFGQPWDLGRAGVKPAAAAAAQSVDLRKQMKQQPVVKPAEPMCGEKRKFESYAEVSGLVMGNNGVQIPGIVNPVQLTRFLHPQ